MESVATNRLHSEPNLTEHLYEEEKRRTNALLFRFFSKLLEQMNLCLETAGSSLENVPKCNVYCTSVEKFAAVNAIYFRYFPKNPPARIFVNVPAWPGHFDIEIDCIAAA